MNRRPRCHAAPVLPRARGCDVASTRSGDDGWNGVPRHRKATVLAKKNRDDDVDPVGWRMKLHADYFFFFATAFFAGAAFLAGAAFFAGAFLAGAAFLAFAAGAGPSPVNSVR